MSGNLNSYLAKMDRLLALDDRYRRPGSTMDMNDFTYLYILAAYSLLKLKELGVSVDTQLELPWLMAAKAPSCYLYDLEYCYEEEEGEEQAAYSYYESRWREMYKPYKGSFSRKNAYRELSGFMYRFFLDLREKNGLGLWTIFSEEDCMELCSTQPDPVREGVSQAITFFMYSRGNTEMLPSMGIDFSEETENEVRFVIDNTLYISGIFALTSAKAEKTAAWLRGNAVQNGDAENFLEKCRRLDELLWRSGANIMADYTNSCEGVTRTQIIGTDNDFDLAFEYAEFSPLLPVYLYYLEQAADAVDAAYMNRQTIKEDTDGEQEREDQKDIPGTHKAG